GRPGDEFAVVVEIPGEKVRQAARAVRNVVALLQHDDVQPGVDPLGARRRGHAGGHAANHDQPTLHDAPPPFVKIGEPAGPARAGFAARSMRSYLMQCRMRSYLIPFGSHAAPANPLYPAGYGMQKAMPPPDDPGPAQTTTAVDQPPPPSFQRRAIVFFCPGRRAALLAPALALGLLPQRVVLADHLKG